VEGDPGRLIQRITTLNLVLSDGLVVKTTGDAGGYGMLMGLFASAKERESYLAAMRKNPGSYIAQPLVELSTHPTHVGGTFEPRRVDLRRAGLPDPGAPRGPAPRGRGGDRGPGPAAMIARPLTPPRARC
jgi:circularly permuted ATPgrasp domain protein